MFKVECPGCKAPYQVDERRVPPTGLKMRCPKCGTSFQVDPPPNDPRRTGPSPVLGAPPPEPVGTEPKKKPPLPPKKRSVKPTVLGVAAPGAGAPKPPPPRPDPTPSSIGSPAEPEPYGEVDLPTIGSPGGSKPSAPSGGGFGEIDLPTASPSPAAKRPAPAAAEADLPAVPAAVPRPGPPAQPGGEVDLPALGGAAAASAGAVDLPAVPTASEGGGGFGEIDLPSPSGGAVGGAVADAGADLPSVGSGAVDLPSPGGGGVDLPSPAGGGVDLPSVGGADLPSPAAGNVGLPAAAADLPSMAADLPQPAAGLPEAAAGLPQSAAGLPQAAAGLPQSAAGLPQTAAGLPQNAAALPQGAGGFGELDLPVVGDDGAEEADPFGAPPPPPPPSDLGGAAGTEADPFSAPPLEPPPGAPASADPAASSPVVRQAGGGTSFGEVNLGGADAGGEVNIADGAASGPPSDDDMEFGAIPQEDEPRGPSPAATAGVGDEPGAMHVPMKVGVAEQEQAAAVVQRRRRGRVRIAVLAGVLVIAGGGALALVPDVGPFGWYVIDGIVNKSKYEQLVAGTVDSTRKELATDTYPSARKALDVAENARASAKRVKPLVAYAAFVAYARGLRFGSESQVSARAKVLLGELAEAQEVKHLSLARAAQAAADGQLARARQSLARLGKDIDVLMLRGELELRAREPKAALEAWTAAAQAEKSARTEFGLARAQYASGDIEASRKHANAALAQSPDHAGGRILLARIVWRTDRDEAAATKRLEEVLKKQGSASPDETVETQTLLGKIHLARSRITHAERAFAEALKIDPKAADALNGFGDALYRAGRFTQALARFEAGAAADPDNVAARVGVAKTKIALERLEDAKGMLKKLRESHPKQMSVQYWFGMAEQKLGNRKEAEAAFRLAIKHGKDDPEVVNAYVALALSLNQQGRMEEARKALEGAMEKLPKSPALHKAIGTVALSQGRYEDAIAQFRAALKLDPDNIGAKFQLAVALRKNRSFDEALKTFDEVAKVDRDYPGLPLERGQLLHEAGRDEEALKEYEEALRKAPEDPDLMLRVGCGYVGAGRGKEAEKLLRQVLEQRSNSAETNHCLGRALLLKGKDLASALKQLERATTIDPHRAEYWLYVGRAANEAGDTGKASSALKKALELDQGLADAYWQRGVLRRKGGAVKDAIKDLNKALELNPNRHEAHADLADCYWDLNREQQALSEWRQAIDAFPNNARFRYRFGKLLHHTRNNAEARTHLLKAIELSAKLESPPTWLSEAHRMAASSIGRNPEAVKHWQMYLKLSSKDHVYRDEAKAALKALGRPYEED